MEEWKCPYCGRVNPWSECSCKGCNAPRLVLRPPVRDWFPAAPFELPQVVTPPYGTCWTYTTGVTSTCTCVSLGVRV